MGIILDEESGRVIKPSAVTAADKLIRMKMTHSVWDVIDEVINVHAKEHPEKWKAYVMQVEEARSSRKDSKFGSTGTKGSNLRYTLDIPEKVLLMIRMLYNPDELPMDRKFFLKFAKRYPKFKVAEKV